MTDHTTHPQYNRNDTTVHYQRCKQRSCVEMLPSHWTWPHSTARNRLLPLIGLNSRGSIEVLGQLTNP
jgi:hypothetical protein